VYSSALAATATADFGLAQDRSAEALRLFRRQQRPWWAARAELALLLCRFGEDSDQAAGLLPAARRVTARLDTMDFARAVDAHLLTGRIALAAGRRDEAARHLQTAANARHRGQLRTRGVGWLAQATWAEAEQRWRGMLAACDRGLALLDLHLQTLGATELRTLATANGAQLAGYGLAARGPPRQRPAVPGVERAVARHGAASHPGPPARRQRPGGRPGRPAQRGGPGRQQPG